MSKMGNVLRTHCAAQKQALNAAVKFTATPAPFKYFGARKELHNAGMEVLKTHPLNPNAWIA